MARLLLNELQFELLDLLVREGGLSFAALFDRAHAITGAPVAEVLKAAQALYDFSLVDVVRTGAGALPAAEGEPARSVGRYVENLDPAELRRCYRQLDAYNAASYLADTRGQADPFRFSASSLGISEHLNPAYAERAAQRPRSQGGTPPGELPPPESLPTLPLE
ncbi:MAG: hypothetical protein KIS92_09410 [Planctomycetota bacterium]|nr:hypothetical protein [Planctomycetota bacterium]